MISPITIQQKLAVLIQENEAFIAESWAGHLRAIVGKRFAESWRETLPNNTISGVRAIAHWFSPGDPADLKEFVTRIGQARMIHSFEPRQVMEGMLSCKGVLVSVIRKTPGLDIETTRAMEDELYKMYMWMAVHLTETLALGMSSYLRGLNEKMASLLEVANQHRDAQIITETLKHASNLISSEASIDHCNFYLISEDQNTLIPMAGTNRRPMPPESEMAFLGKPLVLSSHPFWKEALEKHELLNYYDALADSSLDPDYIHALGIKSLLVIPLVVRQRPLALVMITSFHEYRNYSLEQIELVRSIAGVAALAIENSQLLQESNQYLVETQSIQRVTNALLQELDLEEVLEKICNEARLLTDAKNGSVFFLDSDGSQLSLSFFSGPAPPISYIPMLGSRIGSVLQRGLPLCINHPEIEPNLYRKELMPKNLLAMPLLLGSKLIGALLLANKSQDFTQNDLDVIGIFADQAAIAIENARLHQQVHNLAILEERERLGREIHDNLAQSLSTLKLQTSHVQDLLRDDNVTLAQAQLTEMLHIASEAHLDVREAIFNLRQSASFAGEFLPALQAYLSRFRQTHGIDAQVEIQDGLNTNLPPGIGIQLMRIIQEALTNVRKHSGAGKAWVRLAQSEADCEPDRMRNNGEHFSVEIEDDGNGFLSQRDSSDAADKGGAGVGLFVMQERAESMGGCLKIDSQPGSGTRIRVQVPLSKRRLD